MTELLCGILEIRTIGENEYFIVYSGVEDKSYTIPTNQLLKYGVEVGQRHFFKKELNVKSQQFFLNYERPELSKIKNSYYECGKVYDFKIIDFENKLNKKGKDIILISVEDICRAFLNINFGHA